MVREPHTSNHGVFQKTSTKSDRIESYRIFFKNLEKKKQRIKLSNLFQLKIIN